MARKLLIVERDLAIVGGHHHTQIKAIESLAPDKPIYVVTTQDFALGDTIASENIFPVLPVKSALSILLDFAKRGTKKVDTCTASADALVKKVHEFSMSAADQIVVPSCRPFGIQMLFKIYERADSDTLPVSIIRILSPDVISRLSPLEVRNLSALIKSGKMKVFTETDELAAHISKKFGIECSDSFLLPASILPRELTEKQQEAWKNPRHFTVGCLGQARRGKGSFDIPEIIGALRKLVASSDERHSITILVQRARSKPLQQALFHWRNAKSQKLCPEVVIKVIQSELEPEAFRNILTSVDLLLLPYWVSRYGLRGSGMITDGVLAQKPIVHSEGLSMKNFLSHGNAESAASPEEFARKIYKVISHFGEYETGARSAAQFMESRLAATAAVLAE